MAILYNPGSAKSYIAGAAIAPNLFVKFGANDNTVVPAAAGSDLVIGVSDALSVAVNERVDVFHGGNEGIVAVKFGGTVTRGGLVMSNADGKAIAAAAAAGANVRSNGIALQSAVDGDIAPVLLQFGSFQG